jgi:xanthine dehydrogenase molybdopterin-binding subunit B
MIDPASATVDLPRRDARDKLRGRTLYTVDRGRPGMLHAAIRRAETASAKLLRLDLRKALATPGVRAIITARDAPGLHGIGVADQPLFARESVRYFGEPVAASRLTRSRSPARRPPRS